SPWSAVHSFSVVMRSIRTVAPRAETVEMLAVPKLKGDEIPDHLSVECGVILAVKIKDLIVETGTEGTALARPRIVQHIQRKLAQFRVLQEPVADRNAETVFLLEEHFFGKDPAHRFLEDVAFLGALQFQARRNGAGKFGQSAVEKRITNADA